MTDRAKFEEMLERLIAEDRAGAEELFHEIVVEKSREIYSSILESEEEVEEAEEDDLEESEDEDLDESDDEDLDESEDDDLEESEDEDLDEMFGLDEFETEADPMDMGGDATDDMMGDIEMPGEEGDEEEGDEEEAEGPEEAMADLKDALAALEAEFEKLMGGEDEGDEEGEEEPEEEAMAFEADDEDLDESDDEEVDEATDEEVEESRTPKTAAEQMREYVEKVAPAKMGDNGANAKSIVAGKNDMGGTASNIVAGGTEAGVEANKGQLKGNGVLKGTAKEDNAGNVNVPGAKGATKMASQPGHGAEKKGKPENAANKKSLIGGK